MKSSLLPIAMVVATSSAFAETTNSVFVSIPEPSTLSLIVAGIVALGVARRKIEKAAKS